MCLATDNKNIRVFAGSQGDTYVCVRKAELYFKKRSADKKNKAKTKLSKGKGEENNVIE